MSKLETNQVDPATGTTLTLGTSGDTIAIPSGVKYITAMVLNMTVAGLFGILVPITLKKFNIDPAIASSVFVTTITDVIGFLSFLGVGAFFFYN